MLKYETRGMLDQAFHPDSVCEGDVLLQNEMNLVGGAVHTEMIAPEYGQPHRDQSQTGLLILVVSQSIMRKLMQVAIEVHTRTRGHSKIMSSPKLVYLPPSPGHRANSDKHFFCIDDLDMNFGAFWEVVWAYRK